MPSELEALLYGASGDTAIGMISHLYRFRSIENLLGKHDELRNQEIYFAAPYELNDPMEGLRDIFWRGDRIVWENLFRHYLICLSWAYSLLAILGEDTPIGWDKIPVLQLDDPARTPQQSDLNEEIFAHF